MKSGDLRERNSAGPRLNHHIRVPEVRLVDAEGQQLGVMSSQAARDIAQRAGLDLVEINPKSRPPVCKAIDYGRYKYEQKKAEAEQKRRRTVVEVKEIKLRPKTDNHDLDFKVKHARRFLTDGNKVKVTCRFRGREISHPEVAQRQLSVIATETKDLGMIEVAPRLDGRTMVMVLAPQRS